MTPKIDEQNRQLQLQSQDSLLECLKQCFESKMGAEICLLVLFLQ